VGRAEEIGYERQSKAEAQTRRHKTESRPCARRQRKRPDSIPPRRPPFHSWQPRPLHTIEPGRASNPGHLAGVRAGVNQAHGRAAPASMPRAPRNLPRTPRACSNASPRPPHQAFLLLRLPILLLLSSLASTPSRRREMSLMAPPRSGIGRRRLLLLLCSCALAFPCHGQVTANVSRSSHHKGFGCWFHSLWSVDASRY
jgi:hypothetical protein